MARLIDADALMSSHWWSELKNPFDTARAKTIILSAKTVDAEPVVHGHWVKYNFLGHEQWACSECQTLGSPQWKRCPVCEAKMDGEREKDNA